VKALSDCDRLVAGLAADALAEIGEAAVPALIDVVQDGSHPARLEAVRALAAIGDPRAIPVLFAALDSDSALMEYWANQGLEHLGVGMVFFEP
jgi:HEAT repeat protein